jgi:hypothetical protein
MVRLTNLPSNCYRRRAASRTSAWQWDNSRSGLKAWPGLIFWAFVVNSWFCRFLSIFVSKKKILWIKIRRIRNLCPSVVKRNSFRSHNPRRFRHIVFARACGVWTYEPRQGRKAAMAVCFAIAAVTLAFFSPFPIYDLRLAIYDLFSQLQSTRKS